MKAIRRSMKGERADSRMHHISITPKSAIAIVPPKKVIKALYDYQPDPQNTHELAFNKGDFFHVISREDDPDWYEACNPLIPTARGLVPVTFFEVIGKQERQSGGSTSSGKSSGMPGHDSGYAERAHGRTESTTSKVGGAHNRMSSMGRSGAMVYGMVQYDFNAERPDELEAKAGEAIIVIAQSNPDWFVAKPIGRLGGPGLIPVAFVEIRDMTTGQPVTDASDAVRRAGVPRVEEWKKMTADYKNSSISLGNFESTGTSTQSVTQGVERMSVSNGGQQQSTGQRSNGYTQSYHQRNASKTQYQQAQQEPPSRQSDPVLAAPISASIPRYCFDNDKYWYIIEVEMADGRWWELARYYQDFYDFQLTLLEKFPDEAGNRGKQRSLPFMPGPVPYVTDAISDGRRQSLDEYLKKLLGMPPYISQCQLVRELFAPREGDFEIDPNAPTDDYRLSGASQQSAPDVSRTVSQQSSQGQLDGSPAYSSPSKPGSIHAGHQRAQSSVTAGVGQQYRNQPDLRPTIMNRQASSLTQGSNNSSVAAGSGALKIKVAFQDDIIAIRVPGDITYSQLREKLKDRLKLNEEIMIQYKDDPSNCYPEMISDNDLDMALKRNPKLQLVVNYT
ncbi:MAG: bud emergence protein 1 [Cirrosporium novae-zelandiae]|nr:MAG: bud emergence protein 1 [Cirrosporium novae-zelandiae]